MRLHKRSYGILSNAYMKDISDDTIANDLLVILRQVLPHLLNHITYSLTEVPVILYVTTYYWLNSALRCSTSLYLFNHSLLGGRKSVQRQRRIHHEV